MKTNKIEGLIAAPYTGFNTDGSLNVDIIESYAMHLKQANVAGVFVNGTTGEGVSLSTEERLQAAEEWIKYKDETFKVLIHVGHDSLVTAKRFATHAQGLAADGIGAMAPPFMKTRTLEDLIHFNAAIASGAEALPFYYYHIPSMTGAQYQMFDFLTLADQQIPNIAGIKFTHEDFMDMKLCVEFENQKYTILHGRDEILLAGLALGVTGAIGSTYNYLAPLYHRIITAFSSGDLALANKLQFKAIQFVQILKKHGGGVCAGKSIMKLVGLDLGKPRLPNRALTEVQEQQLFEDLRELEFEGYAKRMSK